MSQTEKQCNSCGLIKPLSDFYFDNQNNQYYSYCKLCKNKVRVKNRAKTQLKNRHKVKGRAIKYKGGKCSNCGYNRCIAALDFHHLNPADKEVEVSLLIARGFSWGKIKKELDKCILLCSNCHRELHWDV